MRRLLTQLFFALFLVSLAGLDGQAQRRLAPVGLVPPNAVAVVKVNWTVTRQDERLKAMVKGNEFERILEGLDIGSSEVSEFVIFSGFNTSPSGTLAVVLSGSYDAQTVTGKIGSQGWTEQQYKLHKIYINPKDNSWLALLRSNILVAGTESGVKRVIDVAQNPQTGLTAKPPFSTLLARYRESRHPISFMMGIPPDYQLAADAVLKVVSMIMSFPGSGPLGWVMGKIGWPRVMGFSITHEGEKFPVELLAMMKDATSAGIISGTLNVVQSLDLGMASNMPPSDREALKNISITRDGALLSIKMVMRESDLPR